LVSAYYFEGTSTTGFKDKKADRAEREAANKVELVDLIFFFRFEVWVDGTQLRA
jgi:hypothetical protein